MSSEGNFTFLIVTDRDALDIQIYKNFLRTEVISDKEKVQPAGSRLCHRVKRCVPLELPR
ncbi:hypothetical protein AGMMS49944_30190 [Spirochaetia bacterium]|nr:hypothetical protein AGMMS49944_30190 [Spirochaetia bacterium]